MRRLLENWGGVYYCFAWDVSRGSVVKPVSFASKFLSCTVMCVTGLTGHAWAETIPHGTVELIAENQWISPGQNYFGLQFELEKGWHIYWINPGDSGQPPRVEWQLPPGVSPGEIEWPAPQRIGAPPIVDFGYEGATTMLVPLRVPSGTPMGKTKQLVASLNVLVCREVCIAGKARVSVTLPTKSARPEPDIQNAGLFAAARQSLPKRPPSNWTFSAIDQKNSFVLIANVGGRTTRASFFPLEESQVDNSARQEILPTATGFRFTLKKSDQLLKPIQRLRGVLELSDNRAYIVDAPIQTGNSAK
jgi:DsbC/DsbD-like thiol-disulfide interchange protein